MTAGYPPPGEPRGRGSPTLGAAAPVPGYLLRPPPSPGLLTAPWALWPHRKYNQDNLSPPPRLAEVRLGTASLWAQTFTQRCRARAGRSPQRPRPAGSTGMPSPTPASSAEARTDTGGVEAVGTAQRAGPQALTGRPWLCCSGAEGEADPGVGAGVAQGPTLTGGCGRPRPWIWWTRWCRHPGQRDCLSSEGRAFRDAPPLPEGAAQCYS